MENNEEPIVVPEKKSALTVANAIVIAAIIIAGAIFVSQKSESVSATNGDKLDFVADVTDQDFIRGNDKAPITIIEYADFSCHFCAQYHPTMQKILSDYADKVRWVYRHLPIFNLDAAIASSCVGKVSGDEAFWKFSDNLFANQDKLKPEYYLTTAISLGVPEADYSTCIKDPTLRSSILNDFNQDKILLGFNATPYTVVIDKQGRKFSFAGALPYDNIKSVLDSLAK